MKPASFWNCMPHAPSRRRLRAAMQGVMLLSFPAAAVFAASAGEREALEEHRALWEAAGIEAYEYAYNKFCDCHREDPPETFVSVRLGEVVGVRHRPFGFDHYVAAEPRNFEWYWTVEGLFDLVDTGLEREADVRVDYDSELGYPTNIYIDYDRDLIGDEVDLRLTRLEPVSD